MKARLVILALAAFAASGALLSCTAGGGSIYATIETEKKVVDSTLPKTLTVGDIAVVGPGVYYLAAGAIFKGTLPAAGNAITWDPTASDTTRPYNPKGALCNALAYFGTSLWGGFFTIRSNLGLYQSDASFAFGSPVADPAVKDKQVTLIQPLNGNLFVVVLSPIDSSYELFYFDGAAWHPALTSRSSTEATVPIAGIGFDGSTYWVVSGANVYSGATFPLSTTSSTLLSGHDVNTTANSTTSLTSVFTDETRHRVFITVANSGTYDATTMIGVYYKDGAGAWIPVPAVGVSSVAVGNLTVAGPVDAAADKYLVGSDGYSYYTISVSAILATPVSAFTRFSDNTIGLYTSAVRKILVDPNRTVFMGTAGNGLWRATFDATGAPVTNGTSNSTWVHE